MKRFWCVGCVTAAVVAGCGGGDRSGSQDALRQRLLSGVAKLGQANTLNASSLYKAKQGADSGVQETGCVKVALDRGSPGEGDDRVSVLAFDVNCSGGGHGYELVAIGPRVWAHTDGNPWRAARIAAAKLDRLASDPDQLSRVMRAAQDIHYSEPGDDYTFTVPASAVNARVKDGDTRVEMTATLDRDGALHELETTAGADDMSATAVQTYEVGKAEPIEAPVADEIKGDVARLRDAGQLRDFIQSVWGCSLPSGIGTSAAC